MVYLGSMTHMTHLVKMNKLPYSNIVVNRNSVSQSVITGIESQRW